jgi:hypothetical protein
VNRQASFAALGASAALVLGCALFLFVGIAAGVWQPRGAPPPRATVAPPGGIPIGARSYTDFLDDVRDGRVVHVSQQGQLVQVDTTDSSYTVEAPPGADVFADISGAAEAGGVDVPPFDSEGLPPTTISYDEFLDEVGAGHITDVNQEGSDIHASSPGREFLAHAPSAETNVLGDIEAAARQGGVDPPFYAKSPKVSG